MRLISKMMQDGTKLVSGYSKHSKPVATMLHLLILSTGSPILGVPTPFMMELSVGCPIRPHDVHHRIIEKEVTRPVA